MNLPKYRDSIIRAGDIQRRMSKIVCIIPFGSHNHSALLHGKTNGSPFSLPNDALSGVIATVEQPRVRKVAIIGYLKMMCSRPHESADHCFREEKASGIACFDGGNLYI